VCSEWCVFLPSRLLRNNKSSLRPAQASRDNYSYWLSHPSQSPLVVLLLFLSDFAATCQLWSVATIRIATFFIHIQCRVLAQCCWPTTCLKMLPFEGSFKACRWLKLRHTVSSGSLTNLHPVHVLQMTNFDQINVSEVIIPLNVSIYFARNGEY